MVAARGQNDAGSWQRKDVRLPGDTTSGVVGEFEAASRPAIIEMVV